MRGQILSLIALSVLAARPDEGQWLPMQIRSLDWETLRKRGMQLDANQLWNDQNGGLVNAAIQIGRSGGCTAALISPEGLVISNHHCADAAIGQASTLKQNYLKEGFVARGREFEAPTNLEMFVVERIDDVTARVHAAQARAQTALERADFTDAEIRKIVDEGERNSELTCQVSSFYEGREYALYSRKRISDVRLVYAPPLRTADFGGNVDNWEWPRHSGDFVLLRAYVAPDGTARPHDADNVPYRPVHWLRVSADGVHEGDLLVIMGYPGRTERYLSSVAVQDWQGIRYPKRRAFFLAVLEVLQAAAASNPQLQLDLSATINAFLNLEKHHLGAIEGLERAGVVDRKIREEEAFAEWSQRTKKDEYRKVLDELLALDHAARAMLERDLVVQLLQGERLREQLGLIEAVRRIVREAKDSAEGEQPTYPAELLESLGADAAIANLEAIQKPLLAVVLDEMRNLPEDQRLEGSSVLADSNVPGGDMVDALIANTAMCDGKARVALLTAGHRAVTASTDPLVVLARGLEAEAAALRVREREQRGARMSVGPRWIAAQQAWRGTSFYPDANSTLRVSIAEVKGYSPRDAVAYQPFTTVSGILDKNRDQEPFVAPQPLKEAARRRWLSRFRDARLGDVPVCFLANGDTSNGNSGSPVINGKGELVGLNFDRVFENVACDFGWDAEHSRNICLDMRFVLWHLESVMPAPALLKELGL